MDSKSTVRVIEKNFTVDSGGNQTLCTAHTLLADGDSCMLDIYVTAEDTSGSINRYAGWTTKFFCSRSGGTVSTGSGGFDENSELIDNGGNLVGVLLEIVGDDINVTISFGNWTSGTQYAVARARIELDTLE